MTLTKIIRFTEALWTKTSGYKTVITGILMIILGLLQEDKEMIFSGLGFIFLRSAVSR